MTRNKTSRVCWMYETTPGTTLMDAVDDVTFHFGRFDKQKLNTKFSAMLHEIQTSHKYSVRYPEITDGVAIPQQQSLTYNPVNPIGYYRFMGDATDASPDTTTYLNTGTKKSYTTRFEQSGGSNDRIIQYNGCFTVGLDGDISLADGGLYALTETFAWMNIDDAGDHPTLTTVPVIPEVATAGAGLPYEQAFDFHRDAGGTPAQVEEVYRVRWNMKQNYTQSYGESDSTISLGTYDTTKFRVHAVLEQNQEWDDFVDRTVQDFSLKIWKPDRTNYQFITFKNAHPIDFLDSGNLRKGHHESVILYEAEYITNAFTHMGSNFSTYYIDMTP